MAGIVQFPRVPSGQCNEPKGKSNKGDKPHAGEGVRQNYFGSLARISLTPRFSGVEAAPEAMKPFQRFPALPSSVLPPTPLLMSLVFSISHSGLGEMAKYIAEGSPR